MPATIIWIGVVALVVVVLGILLAATYNRLVTLRQRYLNAYAQIDVQLKRRYDLIPNLVETVKGYMAHERQTLEAVIAARNVAADASARVASNPRDNAAMFSLVGAENALLGALGRFMALREAYPDLKADAHASELMEQLASTENRIAFARQNYNDSVMQYNAKRQTFPTNLFAGMFGFNEAALFQIDDAKQREVVAVSLSPSQGRGQG